MGSAGTPSSTKIEVGNHEKDHNDMLTAGLDYPTALVIEVCTHFTTRSIS